jgi:hypothetical protein
MTVLVTGSCTANYPKILTIETIRVHSHNESPEKAIYHEDTKAEKLT